MRDRQLRGAKRVGEEAGQIARELRNIHSRSGHNLARIWDDWISSMALAVANALDRRPEVHERREAEYMQIVERHGKQTMESFKAMLFQLVEALTGEPDDVLGGVYMALELGNDHRGQFFTPTSISELVSQLSLDPADMRAEVERVGFMTINDPAIGGGAMMIPMVSAMLQAGLSPSQHLHVTGIDIDASVLRMAYVQLSLLGVPAVLWVGDTLRMEMREDWYTPVHIVEGWGPKLRTRRMIERLRALEIERPDSGEEEPEDESTEQPIAEPEPEINPNPKPSPEPFEVEPPGQRSLFGDGW